MKPSMLIKLLALVLCLQFKPVAAGRTPALPDNVMAEIQRDLESPDANVSSKAMARVREYFSANPKPILREVIDRFMPAMIKGGHFDDVEKFALEELPAALDDVKLIERLEHQRIGALRAAGKPDQALQAAKSLYDVASMDDTADAIATFADCLAVAHPNEPRIAEKFKLDQLIGATTRPAETRPSTSILADVTVDGSCYDQLAQELQKDDFQSLIKKGNLELLADKPGDARSTFDHAYSIARQRDLVLVSEAIARSIRARDCGIAGANAWILSIRPPQKEAEN